MTDKPLQKINADSKVFLKLEISQKAGSDLTLCPSGDQMKHQNRPS